MSHDTLRSTQPRIAHGTAGRLSWMAIGFAAAALLAIDAQAEDSLPPRIAVEYADLNLSVPADAQTLYARLQKAAKRVCGPSGAKDLHALRLQRECYQKSLAAAVVSVNHTCVSEIYRADKSIRLAQRQTVATPRS